MALTIANAHPFASAAGGPMIGMVITYDIKRDALEGFLDATRANAAATHQEAGNRRFEIVQDASNPCRVVLIECYVDEAAKQAHLGSDHFKMWRDATKDAHAASPVFVGGDYLVGSGLG
jgi:autoinducer 2-degrading protein